MESYSHGAMQPPRSGRTIGYVGHDVPVELILAAGALPTAIEGRSDQSTPHADRYLEATFLPASRSIAERWLNGELEDLEAVIFSRSDDSAQRLYYYLCELQRRGLCGGPKPLLYDIASCNRASSLSHTIASTRHLARELGASDDALTSAVQRVRERMELLVTTAESTLTQQPARGSFAQYLLRAAVRDWSEQFDHSLRAQDPSPAKADATRLMLIGSTPAAEQLHDMAERSGANIIATLNAQTPYRFDHASPERDAYEHIAGRCRAHPWRPLLHSPELFCARAIELRVAGVILWTIAEDTGLAWVCPRLERTLRTRGIAVLALTMQRWEIPAGTLNAIADFAAALRSHT